MYFFFKLCKRLNEKDQDFNVFSTNKKKKITNLKN